MSFRKLYRSATDKMVGGVASGIAESYDIDPLVTRLAFVGLTLAGVGIPLYLLLWLVVPADPFIPDMDIRIVERRRFFPTLMKLVAIVACLSLIVSEFEGSPWVVLAGVGLAVGAFFVWRNRESDGDGVGSRISGFASRLYRSQEERKFLGVFGGIAELVNVDPTIVRVIGTVAMFYAAPLGFAAYFLYALLVPARRDVIYL